MWRAGLVPRDSFRYLPGIKLPGSPGNPTCPDRERQRDTGSVLSGQQGHPTMPRPFRGEEMQSSEGDLYQFESRTGLYTDRRPEQMRWKRQRLLQWDVSASLQRQLERGRRVHSLPAIILRWCEDDIRGPECQGPVRTALRAEPHKAGRLLAFSGKKILQPGHGHLYRS